MSDNKQEEILTPAEGDLTREFFIEFNTRYLQFLRGLPSAVRSLITKVVDLDKVKVETESIFLSSFIHYVLPYLDEITSYNQDFFRFSPVRFIYKNHKSLHYSKVLEHMNGEERHQVWIQLYQLWQLFANHENSMKYVEKHYAHRSFYQAIRVFFANKDSLDRQFNASEVAYQESLKVRVNEDTSSEDESSEDESESDSSRGDDQNNQEQDQDQNQDQQRDSNSNSNTPNESQESADASASARGSAPEEAIPNFPIPGMENSIIGKLAQKISQKVDPKTFEGIREPSDLMGALLGGGNAGLLNMMQTVCSSIDETIKSGEVRQEDLLKEAQSMMGQMGNLAEGLGLGGGGGAGSGRRGGGGGGLGGLGNMMNMMNMMGGMSGLANMMGGGGSKKNHSKKHGKKK